MRCSRKLEDKIRDWIKVGLILLGLGSFVAACVFLDGFGKGALFILGVVTLLVFVVTVAMWLEGELNICNEEENDNESSN